MPGWARSRDADASHIRHKYALDIAEENGDYYSPIGLAFSRVYNELHDLYARDTTGEYVESLLYYDGTHVTTL